MPEPVTRRQWALGTLGLASAAEVASAWQHARQAVNARKPAGFEYLDAAAAREIEALASQIIPSDESPGAREAGAIYFIDRALATWEAGRREVYRSGMEQVQRIRAAMFPQFASVAALDDSQIRQVITAIEKSEFFEVLRAHTVLGFLGAPSHGGNRGGVGWAHVGMEDRMIFEPPFGYYDAEAMKERNE